ncbi:MAG TPA: alpha/beta fold hydrolase [Alphaproteobacteria bacterium]|jgi:pimeloyl-ACP methyl ester carboxylesterase|nr:alpha/beta fold hydrolase [Alphaproteobacteria bacterium]
MSETAAPLILVPGLLCTATLWRVQVAELSDAADISVSDEHRRHDNIPDIARAILRAAPQRFSLAGLSFGGYVCFEIMRQAPERVRRLALLDTSARPDDEARRRNRRDLIELSRKGKFLGVTDRLLETFIHPDRMSDAALVEAIKAMAQDVGRDGFIRQQTAIMSRPDSRPDLARIACPTLVLVGRQDRLTPLELHEEMQAGIPGAELAVIEDCGHLSTMERPEAVNAALRRWLERPAPSG